MQKGIPTEQMLLLIGAGLITLHILLWFGGSGDLVYAYSYIMYHFYDAVLPQWEFRTGILDMLKSAAIHAENLSFFDFCTLLNATAYPFVFIYILLCLWTVKSVFYSKRYRFNRQFTLTELARVLSARSPGISHILARYNEFPDQLLNHTDEESASPLSPQEFAVKHQLITKAGKLFRKRKAQKVFRKQINFSSFKNENLHFKPYEAVLAAVFYQVREHNDREFSQYILDTLNLSCLETKDGFPDFSRVMDKVKPVLSSTVTDNNKPVFSVWIKGYRSTRTCLYALLDDDLSIPPSHFRWLKGLDRPLWMALCSVGRGKKFVEGAGIIAYSTTETWLKNEGKNNAAFKMLGATVRAAANGLEQELIACGDVISPRFPEPKGQTLFHDVLSKHLILQPKQAETSATQEEQSSDPDDTENSGRESNDSATESVPQWSNF